MTNPQYPANNPQGYPPAGQPVPGPASPPQAGWQPASEAGQPPIPQPPASKRGNILTSKPVIGIAALVVGLVVGASTAGGGKTTAGTAAAAATVMVTATATAGSEPRTAGEPADTAEPSDQPSDDASAPADTSYKYGQTVGFLYEDVEISVKIESPKASTNMFDRNNLEARTTVCNKGSETIDEMSAQGLGLYAEDKSEGEYSLIGAYRKPAFPVYDYDSAKLKAGKCRTGWISFEDAKKAVRIATEVGDTTYSWSKSGS